MVWYGLVCCYGVVRYSRGKLAIKLLRNGRKFWGSLREASGKFNRQLACKSWYHFLILQGLRKILSCYGRTRLISCNVISGRSRRGNPPVTWGFLRLYIETVTLYRITATLYRKCLALSTQVKLGPNCSLQPRTFSWNISTFFSWVSALPSPFWLFKHVVHHCLPSTPLSFCNLVVGWLRSPHCTRCTPSWIRHWLYYGMEYDI